MTAPTEEATLGEAATLAGDMGNTAVSTEEGRDRQLARLSQVPEITPEGAAARRGWECRRRLGDSGAFALTARSGLRLSLCDTARMTPARQLRQQRPLSPLSGRTSSPTARHRNRFPTSSGRVSTAIAVTAKAAAASSAASEPTKPPPTGRPC